MPLLLASISLLALVCDPDETFVTYPRDEGSPLPRSLSEYYIPGGCAVDQAAPRLAWPHTAQAFVGTISGYLERLFWSRIYGTARATLDVSPTGDWSVVMPDGVTTNTPHSFTNELMTADMVTNRNFTAAVLDFTEGAAQNYFYGTGTDFCASNVSRRITGQYLTGLTHSLYGWVSVPSTNGPVTATFNYPALLDLLWNSPRAFTANSPVRVAQSVPALDGLGWGSDSLTQANYAPDTGWAYSPSQFGDSFWQRIYADSSMVASSDGSYDTALAYDLMYSQQAAYVWNGYWESHQTDGAGFWNAMTHRIYPGSETANGVVSNITSGVSAPFVTDYYNRPWTARFDRAPWAWANGFMAGFNRLLIGPGSMPAMKYRHQRDECDSTINIGLAGTAELTGEIGFELRVTNVTVATSGPLSATNVVRIGVVSNEVGLAYINSVDAKMLGGAAVGYIGLTGLMPPGFTVEEDQVKSLFGGSLAGPDVIYCEVLGNTLMFYLDSSGQGSSIYLPTPQWSAGQLAGGVSIRTSATAIWSESLDFDLALTNLAVSSIPALYPHPAMDEALGESDIKAAFFMGAHWSGSVPSTGTGSSQAPSGDLWRFRWKGFTGVTSAVHLNGKCSEADGALQSEVESGVASIAGASASPGSVVGLAQGAVDLDAIAARAAGAATAALTNAAFSAEWTMPPTYIEVSAGGALTPYVWDDDTGAFTPGQWPIGVACVIDTVNVSFSIAPEDDEILITTGWGTGAMMGFGAVAPPFKAMRSGD